MRHPRRAIPAQPIKHMWERHKEIARLVLVGHRPVDIAEQIGISQTALSIIMNSPIFKDHLQKLSMKRDKKAFEIKDRLEDIAHEATELLNRVMMGEEGASINARARVAQDILDRAGYGKTSIQRNENVNITLNANKIEELKKKRAEMLSAINPVQIPQM